jgi:hypothetical protein
MGASTPRASVSLELGVDLWVVFMSALFLDMFILVMLSDTHHAPTYTAMTRCLRLMYVGAPQTCPLLTASPEMLEVISLQTTGTCKASIIC